MMVPQAPLGRFLVWQATSQIPQHSQLFSADDLRAVRGSGGMVAHLRGTDGSPHHIGRRVCIDVLAARRQPVKTGTGRAHGGVDAGTTVGALAR